MNTVAASNILLAYLKETGDIAEILPDKTFEAPVKKDAPDGLQAYSGLYGTVGSTLRVTIENGEVELPGLLSGMIPAQTYVYTGEEEFTGADGRTVISFDDKTNGRSYVHPRQNLSGVPWARAIGDGLL